jgi:hypothetical protein
MKLLRRRRHLRPRPSRCQIHQQLDQLRRGLQLFRTEWLLEAQQPQPRQDQLRFLHDRIVDIRDAISDLECK